MSAKSTTYQIRFSNGNYKMLQRRAKQRRVSLSAYLRYLVATGLNGDENLTPAENQDVRRFIADERTLASNTVTETLRKKGLQCKNLNY